MGALTLQPATGVDAYLSESAQAANFGATDNIVAGNIHATGVDYSHRIVLQFDASSIPSHATIDTAVLTLDAISGSGISSTTFTAHRVTSDWTHLGVTWLTRDGAIAWTSAGGDYVALAADTTTAATSTSDLVFSSLAALVTDAIQNRSGIVYVMVKGPEDTGSSSFLNLVSSHNATGEKPKLAITYTIYPVVERIARVMLERLENVTTGNGYELTLIPVRPTRTGEELSPQDCLTILAQSTQAARDEENDIEGNPPGMAWIQDFVITGIASPSQTGGGPIDTAANVLAAEIARGITLDQSADWAQFDGLALQARQTAGNIDCDGQLGFANLTYSVTYRTYENNPYTVR